MKASAELIEKLRDPNEKSALIVLAVASIPVGILLVAATIATYGMTVLVVGFLALAAYLAELFAAAYVKGNAIEVGPNQLTEISDAVAGVKERLGIGEPLAVYVMQDSLWNAFASKMAGRRVVVLLSGAVDSLLLKGDMAQVTWLVAHEIGHHAAGHLDFWSRLVVNAGGWLIWVRLWHSRRCELTCDRIALYCCGSVEAALTAIANLTAGAQMAGRVNIDEAIAQWHRHRHEMYVQYRTIYSTHPPHLWRMEETRRAAVAMGLFGRQPAAAAATAAGLAPVVGSDLSATEMPESGVN